MWVLCLLVQLFRACKSLKLWDEKKSIVPTSFLCRNQNIPKLLEAELGDGEAECKLMKLKSLVVLTFLFSECLSINADEYDEVQFPDPYITIDYIRYTLDSTTKTAMVGIRGGGAERDDHNAFEYPPVGDSYWLHPYDIGHKIVTIPSTISYGGEEYSVTSIGYNAFYKATEMNSIKLPQTIESIGGQAFTYCISIDSIVIPNKVQIIEPSTFEFCRALKYAHLGDSIKYIGASAFQECENLKEINIPGHCISIGDDAFMWCKSLSKLIIEDGVDTLHFGCSYKVSDILYFPVTENQIDAQPHYRGQFADTQLNEIYLGRNITFPVGVTWESTLKPEYIRKYRSYPPFELCSEYDLHLSGYDYYAPVLNGFEIGENVTYIPDSLFLAKIPHKGPNRTGGLRGKLSFPSSIRSIGNGAFAWFELAQEDIKIPKNVERIGTGAFSHMYLKKVTISADNIVIEGSAFQTKEVFVWPQGHMKTMLYGLGE